MVKIKELNEILNKWENIMKSSIIITYLKIVWNTFTKILKIDIWLRICINQLLTNRDIAIKKLSLALPQLVSAVWSNKVSMSLTSIDKSWLKSKSWNAWYIARNAGCFVFKKTPLLPWSILTPFFSASLQTRV